MVWHYDLLLAGDLLNYGAEFDAQKGMINLRPDSSHMFLPNLSYSRLRSNLNEAGTDRHGRQESLSGQNRIRIIDKLFIAPSVEYDRRWNQYSGEFKGTTDYRYRVSLNYLNYSLSAEHNREDTLLSDWTNYLEKNKIEFRGNGKIGDFRQNIALIGQRLKYRLTQEDQYLARYDISYQPKSRNMTISNSYLISDENRFERGLRYIEVEPGQGRFIFEEGQYKPDPAGNYIQVEEILSNQTAVKRGEKSFQLNYNPKDMSIRISSNIVEELLASEKRKFVWILPGYSDDNLEYQFRRLNYAGNFKFFKGPGYYYLNLDGSYNYESRNINADEQKKYETIGRVRTNQQYSYYRFNQELSLFRNFRDSYYFSAGKITGYKVMAGVIRTFEPGQIEISFGYRRAESEGDGNLSKQYRLMTNFKFNFPSGGKAELKLTGFSQELADQTNATYRLTDNLNGKQGLNWTGKIDYRLRNDLKISFFLIGKHSDDRKPRISMRGDLIATF